MLTVQEYYYGKSFTFKVNNWEEWSSGKCISKGTIDLIIEVVDKGSGITFSIRGDLRGLVVMPESEYSYDLSHVTKDKPAQYFGGPATKGRVTYNRYPDICRDSLREQSLVELHFEGENLLYLRFGFNSRILEFYGSVVR